MDENEPRKVNLLSCKHSKINGAWIDGEDGWVCRLMYFLYVYYVSSPLW